MMARRRESDAQGSHPQPHPTKRRGRPKGQTPPMVTISGIRVPRDVYDAISVAAIRSRASIKNVVRSILIGAARRTSTN